MDKQNVPLYLAHKRWAMIQIININYTLKASTKTASQSALEAQRVSQSTFTFERLPIYSLAAGLSPSCSLKTNKRFAENLKANVTPCMVSMIFFTSGSLDAWTIQRFKT